MKRRPFEAFFLRTAPIKEKAGKTYTRIIKFVEPRPLTAFVILLAILLGFIVLGKVIRRPKEELPKPEIVKDVSTFKVGPSARLTLHGEVDKSQVLQIVAQTQGIVSTVHVKEGDKVGRGKTLVSIGNNYQGGNTASVQRQIAGVQAQNARDTFGLQKDIIGKQREVAEKVDASSDELRDVTSKSFDETRSLISLNESILSSIDSSISALEATNVGGVNDAQILQTRQLKSQFLAGTNQARAALRANELSVSGDKAGAQLSSLQKDLSLKQLDLQQSQLDLNLKVAGLQAKLAAVSEAAFFPSTPFAATVERIHVNPGETVNPGTVLVTVSGGANVTRVVALVPRTIALSISNIDPSYLILDGKRVELIPTYVASEATDGSLHSIVFVIPEETGRGFTDGEFADLEVPVVVPETTAAFLVPLDSVHQTQDTATVFVISGDEAEGKTVTLGAVQGNFIEITSGLEANDIVIVNRNIVSGDPVKPPSI